MYSHKLRIRSLTRTQALGCAPAVAGYLTAMREVCDKYGVLLIFDEIMCGMGRTGYLHAWQEENVVPDIQLVGKGLAGGFEAVSAMLIGHKVMEAFKIGPSKGSFAHGHTFQNYPKAAAAALETQRIIVDDKLLVNVRDKGPKLQEKIRKRLEHHRYVGNIRGPKLGLFLGVSPWNLRIKPCADAIRLSLSKTKSRKRRSKKVKGSQ